MTIFSYKIQDKTGIHARPAGLLVKAAARFDADITLKNTRNSKTADAKRLFAVMGLEAKCDDTLEISVSGTDESEASKFLEDFFKENL